MGHIFISYNHKDAEYAHTLAETLREKGFDVWIDAAIEYGSEWPIEIQEHLDACEALVVIMTPASYESKWVQNELNRAMRKNKPVFPLLLGGDEPWLSVESTQYTDVRGGKLPPEKFYQLLAKAISQTEPLPSSREPEKPATKFRWSVNPILVFAGILLIAIAAFVGARFANRAPDPTPVIVETFTFTPTVTATALSTVAPTLAPTETSEPTPIPISQPELPSQLISPQDGMTSVHIPAGSFIMGSNTDYEDEKPVHTVILADYWIDKIEVTNYMYGLCVQSGECHPPNELKYYSKAKYADYPVVYVTWEDATLYCAWAGRRLPTEAEWEKAARGTDGRVYPWGDEFNCQMGNFDDENQYDVAIVKGGPDCDGFIDIAPAGSFPDGASPYGVLDMAGNVWEWVADWYHETYYRRSPSENPPGPTSGELRVIRGGAWNYLETTTRTSNRLQLLPTSNDSYTGIRCATSESP